MQAKAQPTNYGLRFKLGMALYQGGRFNEAISEFQTAVKDPQKKLQAYVYMGQAFLNKKDFDMAIEQFKNALQTLSPKDRLYKDTLYHLGMAYEAANRKADAIESFMTIYKEDIKYRDVQERLNRLKQQ